MRIKKKDYLKSYVSDRIVVVELLAASSIAARLYESEFVIFEMQ